MHGQENFQATSFLNGSFDLLLFIVDVWDISICGCSVLGALPMHDIQKPLYVVRRLFEKHIVKEGVACDDVEHEGHV